MGVLKVSHESNEGRYMNPTDASTKSPAGCTPSLHGAFALFILSLLVVGTSFIAFLVTAPWLARRNISTCSFFQNTQSFLSFHMRQSRHIFL